MGRYNPHYYTLDRLSDESLVLVENSLKRFMRSYDVTETPVDCFQLLNKIQEKRRINLDVMYEKEFSYAFDATAKYFSKYNGYLIIIKTPPNNWKAYSSRRRCNFTLAHELGHVFCGHLLIPDEYKTKEDRRREEDEADEFAGRLLMPEGLILRSQFSNRDELSRAFLVSDQAVFKRLNNLKRLDLFDVPKKSACPRCGNDQISPAAEYCDICGEYLPEGRRNGVRTVGYDRHKTNDWGRVVCCLVCENEEISIGASYCKICGTPLYNQCDSDDFFTQCTHVNSAGARYCELCGSQTVYYRRGILPDWKTARNEYIRSVTQR